MLLPKHSRIKTLRFNAYTISFCLATFTFSWYWKLQNIVVEEWVVRQPSIQNYSCPHDQLVLSYCWHFQILPTQDMSPSMMIPYQHLTSPLPPPMLAPSNILSSVWTEDPVIQEERKIEKQRSVTFGSIDLLETIEEDYSLESRV